VPLKPILTVVYHDFTSARLNQDLGTEWDEVATFALTPRWSLMMKHADFDQCVASAPASRAKSWILFQYKL